MSSPGQVTPPQAHEPSPDAASARTIAADEWDAFVAQSPHGTVFAESWWLDAVAGPERWRQNAVRNAGGDLVAAWPTILRRTRAGDVHVGAPLTPYLGPLLTPGTGKSMRSREQEQVDLLLEAMRPYAHVEARCAPAYDYWTPLSWQGFGQTTCYTWRIEETGDIDAVRSRVHSRTAGAIRKALKSGILVEDGSADDLNAMLHATFDRQGLAESAPSSSLVERVTAESTRRGRGELLAARDADGRLHAAGLFVHDARSTWYLSGGADAALRSSGAMSLLIWTAIEHAAGRGTAFDFEGSMLPSLERYFRSFGGTPAAYSVVRHTPSAAWRRSTAVRRAVKRLVR